MTSASFASSFSTVESGRGDSPPSTSSPRLRMVASRSSTSCAECTSCGIRSIHLVVRWTAASFPGTDEFPNVGHRPAETPFRMPARMEEGALLIWSSNFGRKRKSNTTMMLARRSSISYTCITSQPDASVGGLSATRKLVRRNGLRGSWPDLYRQVGMAPRFLPHGSPAVHAESSSVASMDWRQITLLYDQLLRIQPSPVVELNRAVAVAMCEGPEQGLCLIDDLLAPAPLPLSPRALCPCGPVP